MLLVPHDVSRLAPPLPQADARNVGRGHVELTRINDRTVVTRLAAGSPLKLLCPKSHSDAAWVFASTYGGGLVGGDLVRIDVDAAEHTRCLLSTQASTKVYKTLGPVSRQELFVRARSNAVIVSAPDPIVCYAGAKFEQRNRFEIAPDSAVVMIDWFTSGRRARGERWAFDRFVSHTEIIVDDRCLFRDSLVLDPADGDIAGPMRMGACDVLATIVVVGSPVRLQADWLLGEVAKHPASRKGDPLLFSASPIEGGAVLRVAAGETEALGRWIRDRLSFVADLLGQDPWSRKW